jgi:hypothetical protein
MRARQASGIKKPPEIEPFLPDNPLDDLGQLGKEPTQENSKKSTKFGKRGVDENHCDGEPFRLLV